MATLAANVYREAELQKRIRATCQRIAERRGIEFPPPFPHAHDDYYRRNDEWERMAIFLDRVDAADEERNGNG